MTQSKGPLSGLKVVDVATLFAGPLIATLLADFGAEVIKVEHPRGDAVRDHGHQKQGISLWWTVVGRNKHAVTLYLGCEEGQSLFRELVADADVLIEAFRPGTLEKWGLGPTELHALNPKLIIARVTGFGQQGPYRTRPGFGTLAESMSGFAHITGQPDGPPTLPPFGFGDGVAALAGASAVMMALYHRDANAGRGQVIDLALIEPILTLLGPQPSEYDQLGIVQQRTGNRSHNNAPRNIYPTADGRWVAISASAQAVAERVMRLVGHPEVIDAPWFKSGRERAAHAEVLDGYVAEWILRRDLETVVLAFEAAEAAVAPIYDVAQLMADPQYRALNSITSVDHPQLGPLKMQNVMFRLSETPGTIRWPGRALGEDNARIYGDLGLDSDAIDRLRQRGVI